MMNTGKKRVLFLCTHNSSRSQMAEALLRDLRGDYFEAFSAGTEPTGIHPYTIKVMEETGIDMTGHASKGVEAFLGQSLDYVATVCDNANESCPFFPEGAIHLHKSFRDPAAMKGSDEEVINGFRQVRDEIRSWIESEFTNDRSL